MTRRRKPGPRRRRFAPRLAALSALCLLLPAAAGAVPEVPELRGRVNDLAGLLAPDEARALESRLADFERETSHQIVVLTVPSLEGEAVEAFAIRVADAWQIGHEDLDNGVIVVVSAGDRRARIEVGYGLEGVIPDAVAARILRERMIPRSRESVVQPSPSNGIGSAGLSRSGVGVEMVTVLLARSSVVGGSVPPRSSPATSFALENFLL